MELASASVAISSVVARIFNIYIFTKNHEQKTLITKNFYGNLIHCNLCPESEVLPMCWLNCVG